MADRKVRARVDTLGQVFVKEDIKIVKSAGETKVILGVLFDEHGQYCEPYQIKHNIGYRTSELAQQANMPYLDYVNQQAIKKYAPLYYSLLGGNTAKRYLVFTYRQLKSGESTLALNYYIIKGINMDGNIELIDMTTEIAAKTLEDMKKRYFDKVSPRIFALIN